MDEVLIEILVGLPGSGKTHYAEENGADTVFIFANHKGINYIDFDKEYISSFGSGSVKTIEQILSHNKFAHYIKYKKNNYNHWIFDGLFLTNSAQENVVSEIDKQIKKYNIKQKIHIQFIYFKEDREACLYNDSIRNRETKADIMISGADYEKPNIKKLTLDYPDFNFTLVEKEVHKMNLYESKFKIHEDYRDKDVMKSDSWSLGGSWGDCWGNSGSVSAEQQPSSFVEFDDLLLELCPNIPFLQYKNLYNHTVKIEVKDEYDYYGGHTQYAYFTCDLKKLYSMMLDMGLINK